MSQTPDAAVEPRLSFAASAVGHGVLWLVFNLVWVLVDAAWISEEPIRWGTTLLGIAAGAVFFGVAMAGWMRWLERRAKRGPK